MGIFESIILGIVQGIAEFLPISSSAHLIIFRDIFGIGAGLDDSIALTFDIALHLGTILAIGIYFFWDFINMIKDGFTKGINDEKGKILWFIIIATIPAAIMGILFEDIIENIIRGNYLVIASALIVMGIIIYLVDMNSKNTNSIKKMSWLDALWIGCLQVFALIPGFSRSGTTITAARLRGIDKEDAAKFSFFLAMPVILGAVLLEIIKTQDIMPLIMDNMVFFISGIIAAFITGIICIKFLLSYLKKHDFKIFMWYRIVIAVIVIIWTLFL